MSIQSGLFPFEAVLSGRSDKLRTFADKDPGKVDRSGANASRYVARRIVASGIATRCTVQLLCTTGRAVPISSFGSQRPGVCISGTRVPTAALLSTVEAISELRLAD